MIVGNPMHYEAYYQGSPFQDKVYRYLLDYISCCNLYYNFINEGIYIKW